MWRWRARKKSLGKNRGVVSISAHTQKKNGKFISRRWQGLSFLGSYLETTIWFLVKLFITLLCHNIKPLWKLLVQASCLLDKTNQENLKIPPFSPGRKKFTNFWGADFETMIQFLPELFLALQCHKIKLLLKFLVQAICLLDKTNQ